MWNIKVCKKLRAYLEVAAEVQEGGDLLRADRVRVEEVAVADVEKVVALLRWWRVH